MTDEQSKLRSTHIQALLENTQNREKFSLKLTVAGGFPGQAPYILLHIDGTGKASCKVDYAPADVHIDVKNQILEAKQVETLLRVIMNSDVLAIADEPFLFQPDSLTGLLELEQGQYKRQFRFYADSHQAPETLSSALRQVLNQVYLVGKDVAGIEIDPDENFKP